MFAGDLQKVYDFSFRLNLFGRIVPGNGTLQFDFGTLTPIGGYVSPGTYQADPARISFDEFDNPRESVNTFEITVIPEPSVNCLGGVGLTVLFMLRVMKRGVSKEPNVATDHAPGVKPRHASRQVL